MTESSSSRWTHVPEDVSTEGSMLSEATSGAGKSGGGIVLRIAAEQASDRRCLSNESNAGMVRDAKDMPEGEPVYKMMRKG
jgi:hypothetical protein